MKNNKFSKDVKLWINFASYDLKTAKWEFKGKIYTSSCYACQQAAEKSFKALFLSKGHPAPKIHSLDRLLSALSEYIKIPEEINNSALKLDKYYIVTRYPGQYGGPEGLFDADDAKEAIKSAENIIKFVKNKI